MYFLDISTVTDRGIDEFNRIIKMEKVRQERHGHQLPSVMLGFGAVVRERTG
jgi:hypothetical protein